MEADCRRQTVAVTCAVLHRKKRMTSNKHSYSTVAIIPQASTSFSALHLAGEIKVLFTLLAAIFLFYTSMQPPFSDVSQSARCHWLLRVPAQYSTAVPFYRNGETSIQSVTLRVSVNPSHYRKTGTLCREGQIRPQICVITL